LNLKEQPRQKLNVLRQIWERNMHTRSLEHAARFGRVAALALVGFLIVAPAPDYVFAQDGGSVATGDGGSTGEAGGGDTSSAGTNTSGSVATGDGTADSGIGSTGTAETSGSPPADATTTATSTANVVQDGSGYDATSSATGGGGAGGGAIGSVTATASADTTGVNPTASASTTGGIVPTSAVATFGAAPNAVAPGGKEIEKQTAKKSVAIAIAPDGSYSIAVAKKNSAYAKSGANYYGKTLNAAVGAMVAAYAKATRSYGLANASASAWASSRGGSGYAKSSSWTNAFACVGSGCQRKTNLSRRSLRKLLVRCTWHERNHILTCPPNIPYASARR
jgi:hypothetical protein